MWRPPRELPDNTAQGSYFWYVRPCKSLSPLVCNPDPASLQSAATNAFRKQSPPVALQTPANGSTVTGLRRRTPPLFTWTDYLTTNQQAANAYDGATEDPSYEAARTYRIQISQASNFSTLLGRPRARPAVLQPQRPDPPAGHDLLAGAGHWTAAATTSPGATPTASATTSRPSASLPPVTTPSPVGGVTVAGSTPFRWAPMNGAYSYTIEVYKNDDVRALARATW